MKFNVGFKDIFEMWGWSGIVVASFILIIIYYFKSDFVKSIFSKITAKHLEMLGLSK